MYESDSVEDSHRATGKISVFIFNLVLSGWIIFKSECTVYEKQKQYLNGKR